MSTDIDIPSNRAAAQRADYLGQATAVEQSRAVAEVQASVIVAQQVPRNMQTVVAEMRESCGHLGLADRAFYKFPRAGGTVSGASVHLARELARCFGNIQYGIDEMRRDDRAHESEMKAWAWDVQTNTRSSQTFVVPHKRDKKGGPELLIDLRDVYENNANQGARRVREAIFSVLPTWFTEEAKALCIETQAKGTSTKTLAQQVADAVRVFEEVGIKLDRLERKIGSATGDWTPHDLAGLRVSYASIKQGTVTKDEEFPPIVVGVDDITGPAAAPTPAGPVSVDDIIDTPEPEAAPETAPAPEPPPAPTKARAPRVPTNKAGDPAGTEYGDVKTGKAQSLEGVLSPEQMIVKLAAAHGVEGGDAVARMSSQILGRQVVGPVDFNGAETARVKRTLEELGEDEPFVFADAEPADPSPTGDEIAATSPQDADAWRTLMAECGVSPTVLVSHVRERFPEFKGYSDIGLLGIGDEVAAWVRAQKPAES